MSRWMWFQLALFQILWLTAVIGQNDWLLLACLLLLLHFILSPGPRKDMYVLPVAIIGFSIDTLLSVFGLFEFSDYPYWLMLVWAGFILSLSHSLQWLKHMPMILVVPLGAIMGTASYVAGWKLEAVDFPYGLMVTALILAAIWSILLPLLIQLDTLVRRLS